jgi:hypothetical protein
MKDLSKYPIFLIGTSRSGTELMSQQILSKHSKVRIAMETHYFEDLRPKMAGREQTSLTPEEAKVCEDYFLALTHKIYKEGGDPEKGWMKRTELRQLANEIGLGSDFYFEAFCRLYAKQNDKNKTRWGEKTPRHVFRIREIITRYPNAKFVFMLRHPGGVIASYRNFWKLDKHSNAQKNRLKNSYNLLIVSLLWKAAFKAVLNARQQFGEERIYIQRFEDLIEHPESSVKSLTTWLGLDYQTSMLEEIALINSPDRNPANKDTAQKAGLVKQAAYRWREQLSEGEIAAIQLCCDKLIQQAGYESKAIKPQDWLVIARLWMSLPFTFIKALMANSDRIDNIFKYVWSRLSLGI